MNYDYFSGVKMDPSGMNFNLLSSINMISNTNFFNINLYLSLCIWERNLHKAGINSMSDDGA